MNRNYLVGFAVAVAVLGLLAFAAWSLFEIYPVTRDIPPSREARVNEYLALDRWLAFMGRNIRVEDSGDLSLISRAKERQIFIQSSLFKWDDDAEYLVQWVLDGGTLFLALDDQRSGGSYQYNRRDRDAGTLHLLEEFGIKIGAGAARGNYRYNPDSPNYDRGVAFEMAGEAAEADDLLTLKDWSSIVRLVQVKRGKGKFIVSGLPVFLRSSYIERAPNARLAWALFAAESEPAAEAREGRGSPPEPPNNDWLFIRGSTRPSGLLGDLFREGNLPVLLVSILVLLVVCFWAVIPLFGLVRGDDAKPGKPLRERFLAEGRFLKRYGALEFYRQVYMKEIKRRLARKEGLCSDDEIQGRIREILGRPGDRDSRVLAGILHGGSFRYKDLPRMIIIFNTILERI